LEGGCQTFKWIKDLKPRDEKEYKGIYQTVREASAYSEAGENDNPILEKLVANLVAVGVYGYDFVEDTANNLRPMSMQPNLSLGLATG